MKTVIVSCEHGTAYIPFAYEHAFRHALSILKTHRGLDIGIIDIARALALRMGVDLIEAKTSRLLVECNRSINHEALFSTFSLKLTENERAKILEEYYFPYVNAVEKAAQIALDKGHTVIHISMHSFTPMMNNIERNCEIGLLYDPKVNLEDAFACSLKNHLESKTPAYRVKMNYPYLGTSDGLTQTLRTLFKGQPYIGLEVELNQALTLHEHSRKKIGGVLIDAIEKTVAGFSCF